MAGAIPGGFSAARAPGLAQGRSRNGVLPANVCAVAPGAGVGARRSSCSPKWVGGWPIRVFPNNGAVLAETPASRGIPLDLGLELNGF